MIRRRRRFTRAQQRTQYGACPPPPPPQAYNCPPPLRQSDEHYCTACQMRWAANEDKPPCPNGNDPR